MSHLPKPEYRGSYSPLTNMRRIRVHVLKCDGEDCEHECWNDGDDPVYATYVPSGWRTNQDGTHRCPDCVRLQQTGHLVSCHENGCMHHCKEVIAHRARLAQARQAAKG